MTSIPDSFNKTFPEQTALLRTDEEVPLARVVIMALVIHFLATGERLILNSWVRCNDKDSCGDRVIVGRMGSTSRPYITTHPAAVRFGDLGLASCRKF